MVAGWATGRPFEDVWGDSGIPHRVGSTRLIHRGRVRSGPACQKQAAQSWFRSISNTNTAIGLCSGLPTAGSDRETGAGARVRRPWAITGLFRAMRLFIRHVTCYPRSHFCGTAREQHQWFTGGSLLQCIETVGRVGGSLLACTHAFSLDRGCREVIPTGKTAGLGEELWRGSNSSILTPFC